GLLDAHGAGAGQPRTGGNAGGEPPDVSEEALHLDAIQRQRAAVHAAFHAAVDALLQRADLAFASAILGELPPCAGERHGIGLRAVLEVAVLAGEIVAGVASGGIRSGRADLVRRIDHQGVAVFDKPAERVVPDRADLRWRPRAEVKQR